MQFIKIGMADDGEAAQLRAAIARLGSERLKTHMLQALDAFEAAEEATTNAASSSTPPVQQQPESDQNDPVAVKLRGKCVVVSAARDALFLAVHTFLQETGFRVDGAESDALPPEWDATSAAGLFAAAYRHPHDLATKFALQGLFVGNKFEVYLSVGEQTHSIELSTDAHVASDAALTLPTLGADLLRDLDALRKQLVPFLQNIVPKKKQEARGAAVSSPAPTAPSGGNGDFPFPAPRGFPPVGSGDVLPPGLGGGDPGMLVGPDSALFGQRFDPSRGPVPGARFDPFGPPIDPLQIPGRGGRGGFRPGPNLPFGTPNPDHLRMPTEFDDNMGFGFGRPPPGREGGGGGGFGGGSQPFGSDHAFY